MAGPNEDRDYFTLRAAQERAIAITCEDNSAALAHLRMAEEYSRRAAEAEIGTDTDISTGLRINDRTRAL
ncbi:MAG TPA: hypothetical protein VN029_08510 [Sphingomonas sp.]|nr:hypothetical protein [Sphingomonas sp.]